LEYCENGSLVDYLRKHESTGGYVNIVADGEIVMTLEWKQSRVLEICNGMKYLAKHRVRACFSLIHVFYTYS
jgi:serine/threonine protein kinase